MKHCRLFIAILVLVLSGGISLQASAQSRGYYRQNGSRWHRYRCDFHSPWVVHGTNGGHYSRNRQRSYVHELRHYSRRRERFSHRYQVEGEGYNYSR